MSGTVLAPVQATFRAVADTVVPEAASLGPEKWREVQDVVESALAARSEALRRQLVIFLRPIVIRDASLEGDYRSYRDRLPTADYFRDNPNPPLPQWELGTR